MAGGRSRTRPEPKEGGASIAADGVAVACNGDGESGRDCGDVQEAGVEVTGVKADAALIMTAAATLSTLSDRTIFSLMCEDDD